MFKLHRRDRVPKRSKGICWECREVDLALYMQSPEAHLELSTPSTTTLLYTAPSKDVRRDCALCVQLEALWQDRHGTLDETAAVALKDGKIQLLFGVLGNSGYAYFLFRSMIGTTVFREICIIPEDFTNTKSNTADLARVKK